ncbi:hypothetical protein HNR21_005837 [Actinomadura cellulosilytica]|uniref:Uncharacterized protein n=1 Tax=Thermomonospora cellulosilytica TaxID=1411118 RepID=A0A7W3N3Q3_9ACTN|nr:hypothetical protein [Thermomonospora cellulosilytica]
MLGCPHRDRAALTGRQITMNALLPSKRAPAAPPEPHAPTRPAAHPRHLRRGLTLPYALHPHPVQPPAAPAPGLPARSTGPSENADRPGRSGALLAPLQNTGSSRSTDCPHAVRPWTDWCPASPLRDTRPSGNAERPGVVSRTPGRCGGCGLLRGGDLLGCGGLPPAWIVHGPVTDRPGDDLALASLCDGPPCCRCHVAPRSAVTFPPITADPVVNRCSQNGHPFVSPDRRIPVPYQGAAPPWTLPVHHLTFIPTSPSSLRVYALVQRMARQLLGSSGRQGGSRRPRRRGGDGRATPSARLTASASGERGGHGRPRGRDGMYGG